MAVTRKQQRRESGSDEKEGEIAASSHSISTCSACSSGEKDVLVGGDTTSRGLPETEADGVEHLHSRHLLAMSASF